MKKKRSKKRLDVLLVERNLAESRAQAQRLIRAGLVRVVGQVADKPGTQVATNVEITLQACPRFVSRGGDKLEAALVRFGLDVTGMVAADVGASTGGFTDCLLQHGACRVYAIDVGYGQLAWRLRNDRRVVVMERTNARYLEDLPEPVDMVTADVSFISLGLILPMVVRWFTSSSSPPVEGGKGRVVALIKPQFEAGRREVGKGGVVRDLEVHRRVLERVLSIAAELGLVLCGLMPSPLRGPAGNVEFLAWWRLGGERIDPTVAVAACLDQVPEV
ncbi:MAG: TlyA family RNA methyltransferase [Chloroflexota bacterium]|nr:TlyA family RNA methyltransferase [Chloroflexota bacterium]